MKDMGLVSPFRFFFFSLGAARRVSPADSLFGGYQNA
jgi:hypothetical protein